MWDVFKIQSGPLTATQEKFFTLRCKICDDTIYFGKAKTRFHHGFHNYKIKHQSFREGKRKIPQNHFHSFIQEKCEVHERFKNRETFRQQELKTFYPFYLNKK